MPGKAGLVARFFYYLHSIQEKQFLIETGVYQETTGLCGLWELVAQYFLYVVELTVYTAVYNSKDPNSDKLVATAKNV